MDLTFSREFKIYRFKTHYASLYPPEDLSSESRVRLWDSLKSVDVENSLYITSREDICRNVFIYLFVKKGFVDYMFIPAYRLVDIYLDKDEIESISSINVNVCTYLGYGEMDNKRQSDLLIQLYEELRQKGKVLWIFNKTSGIDKYIQVYNYFSSSKGAFCLDVSSSDLNIRGNTIL